MTTERTAMSSSSIKYPITWTQAERISQLVADLKPDLWISGVTFSTLPLHGMLTFTVHVDGGVSPQMERDFAVVLRARLLAAFTLDSCEADGMDAWTWDHLVRSVTVSPGKDGAWHARIPDSGALSPHLWAKWEELAKEEAHV